MITFDHLSKKYADKIILDNVSGTINRGDRIALIGKNGAGKTTLLKLLQGDIRPDAGSIQSVQTIGYVQQEIADKKLTVQQSFVESGWRVDAALYQVGLAAIERETQISTLSGGQQTRLSFAHVFAQDPLPEVLLLDEPTNNLDAEGLQWLRQFTRNFDGAILLVSHDRAFINDVATVIWELENGALTVFGGSYDTYKQEKLHRRELLQKQYDENVSERKKVQNLIKKAQVRASRGVRDQRSRDNDKFLKTFKNTQVQNSLGGQAKALQSRLSQLDTVERPEALQAIHLDLKGAVHPSKLVLEVEKLSKTIAKRTLFESVTFTVRGNQRILISGPNGAGKSTLFKLIMEGSSRHISIGMDIHIGYFSQDMYGVASQSTPLDLLLTAGADTTQAHTLARQMNIDPRELRGRIAALSRGQQAKLGFIRLLLGNYDVLLLDEPTNHLDIETREAIEQALMQYKGAILFASHDRYFRDLLKPSNIIHLRERLE